MRVQKNKRKLAQQGVGYAFEIHFASEAFIKYAYQREKACLYDAAQRGVNIDGCGGSDNVPRSAEKGIKTAHDRGVKKGESKRLALRKRKIQ